MEVDPIRLAKNAIWAGAEAHQQGEEIVEWSYRFGGVIEDFEEKIRARVAEETADDLYRIYREFECADHAYHRALGRARIRADEAQQETKAILALILEYVEAREERPESIRTAHAYARLKERVQPQE